MLYCCCKINHALTTQTHGKKAKLNHTNWSLIMQIFFPSFRNKQIETNISNIIISSNARKTLLKCNELQIRWELLDQRVISTIWFQVSSTSIFNIRWAFRIGWTAGFFIYEIEMIKSQYLITIRQVNCFEICHCVWDVGYGQVVTSKQSQIMYQAISISVSISMELACINAFACKIFVRWRQQIEFFSIRENARIFLK